ncbi:TonB-dependent receptor plug domain-containing protein [Haloferula sargassicola]
MASLPALEELGELVVDAEVLNQIDQVDRSEADAFFRTDLAESLSILPGVSLQRVGARSETMVTVRGFDLRQVPVLIDGIPVYVPYDGYADLGRFLVPNGAEMEVAKGISPVLAGPNALGGLINVHTRRPEERLEDEIRAGAFTGDGWKSGLAAGGREERWYWQFDLSWIEQDAFRLSDDFQPVPTEDGGRRENSWRQDFRASGRIAWTPAGDDEYALGFWIQRGEKGNPPYTGSDPTIRARFWQWPQWDKTTVYFLSRTEIGNDTVLETTAHYDRFENLLQSYDDATYSTQTRPYTFNSYYDDWIAGASAKIENRSWQDLRLAAAVHYERDHHEEWEPATPTYTFEDETLSIGFEAERTLLWDASLTAGISHDWRNIREAVDTNTGAPLGGSKTSSWNPQVIYRQSFGDAIEGHLGYAGKSRFPTIKDRYSYRLGQAISNPDLQPESADHFDIGIRGSHCDGDFNWQLGLFYSRITDAIQRVDNVAFDPSGAGLFQLRNVGKVEHHGLELAINRRWSERIESGIRYAWTEAENRTDSSIFVTGVPEHEVLLYSTISPVEGLRLIPSYTWADSRVVTTTGKRVGHYARLDFRAEIQPSDAWTLGLGVTNLLDRNQQLDEGFPEPGRSYYLDLKYEF